MAHMARADGDEETTADEDRVSMHGPGRVVTTTDAYIERIVGPPQSDETDSDVETTNIKPSLIDKGKRKAGVKVQFSDDEEDDEAYQKFKNRKKAKRQKIAATKKRLNTKAKDNVVSRKRTKENGESPEKERVWGKESDYEMVKGEVPEYLHDRRRAFDKRYQLLKDAGLQLPPRYDDIVFSDDQRLAELEERPVFPKTVEKSRPYKDISLPHSGGVIPASIAQYLRDYQVDGVAFLHELFVYQKGGILGDDMGLGKTVQVAAFLVATFGKTGDERDAKRMRKMRRAPNKPWYPRVLIICPGSLIDNWKNELARWGFWHVEKFHGSKQDKDSVLQTATSGRCEVVITTYNTYKNHKEQLNMIKWDCIVADECHQIKESGSQITQAMNEVNALCRIGLTGTAIQNKYEELWTLLNWTNPGRFGPLSKWNSSISAPLRVGQSHDATVYQLKQARLTAKKLVHNLLPEFFLRRMKSLIAHQLPKKSDRVVFCPLTETQKCAYEHFLESDIVEVVKSAHEPCPCESGKQSGFCCYSTLPGSNTKWQALVFPAITTLQKLSNHLALLIPNSEDPPDKQEQAVEFLQKMVPNGWKELYASRDSLKNLAQPDFCGKWSILKKLLNFWHENGDKVLIFSHSVRLLKMLRLLFKNTSYNVSFLSGEMKYEDRQQTVDDFNSDPTQFVFLISTKAGGVGLNITSANKVVIFDPNWNPSYDLQAQDRAYRIGQQRDVEVFRLVSAGTVEEVVYARQVYKQQQANIAYDASTERRYFKGVQKSKDQKGEIFGLDNLLSFHGDDIFLRGIVNKTNVAEARKGVRMIEMNMEDVLDDDDNPLKVETDDEDRAMSQLAALLTEKDDGKKKSKKPKTDAILAILASAGVEYTHENSELVGSSRVEAQLSRRAEETGNDVDFGEMRLFAESQSQANEPGTIEYEFHPPEDVMMRQFCTMAKTYGFANPTEFALVVEGWTQKQRTDCLERFYLKRKARLAELEMGKEGIGNPQGQLQDDRTETKDEDSRLPNGVVQKLSAYVLDDGSETEDEPELEIEKVSVENVLVGVLDDTETEDDDDDEL